MSTKDLDREAAAQPSPTARERAVVVVKSWNGDGVPTIDKLTQMFDAHGAACVAAERERLLSDEAVSAAPRRRKP